MVTCTRRVARCKGTLYGVRQQIRKIAHACSCNHVCFQNAQRLAQSCLLFIKSRRFIFKCRSLKLRNGGIFRQVLAYPTGSHGVLCAHTSLVQFVSVEVIWDVIYNRRIFGDACPAIVELVCCAPNPRLDAHTNNLLNVPYSIC